MLQPKTTQDFRSRANWKILSSVVRSPLWPASHRFEEQAAQLSRRIQAWEVLEQQSAPAYCAKIDHLLSLIFGTMGPMTSLDLVDNISFSAERRQWTRDSQAIAAY